MSPTERTQDVDSTAYLKIFELRLREVAFFTKVTIDNSSDKIALVSMTHVVASIASRNCR